MEAPAFRFVSLLALFSLVMHSVAVMLGYYGAVEVAVVGPGCSRLVQGIKVSVEAGSQGNGGLMLDTPLAWAPPLDTPAEWLEVRRVVVPAKSHRQWAYLLDKGARLEGASNVKSGTDVGVPYPPCIIIAQGKESFMHWTEMSSVQSSTLSCRMVQDCLATGNGTIEHTVNLSSECYTAVSNLGDHEDTTVQLVFRIRTLLYNTSGADVRCSPGHGLCTYRLPFLGHNVAVLSSGHEESQSSDAQHVRLSYEPRWIVYVVGSAILAAALLLLYEILSMLLGPCTGGGGGVERRAPLLTDKEDDGASLGSSYDSVSHDGSDGPQEEREEGGCALCCDAAKDCFFLPCGHSATCYPCGARTMLVQAHGGKWWLPDLSEEAEESEEDLHCLTNLIASFCYHCWHKKKSQHFANLHASQNKNIACQPK